MRVGEDICLSKMKGPLSAMEATTAVESSQSGMSG